MRSLLFVIRSCLSVRCLSVCDEDHCKSNQPISVKRGVMIGPTSCKNWLTFGSDPVPDTDCGSFPVFHHWGIGDFRRYNSISLAVSERCLLVETVFPSLNQASKIWEPAQHLGGHSLGPVSPPPRRRPHPWTAPGRLVQWHNSHKGGVTPIRAVCAVQSTAKDYTEWPEKMSPCTMLVFFR